MELILYQTADNDNVINKDKEEIKRYDIVLKDPSDIVRPIIRLNEVKDDLSEIANYAYLTEFDRYYFIRSIGNTSKDIWVLTLECDVLESFKDDILASQAEVIRPLRQNDYQATSVRTKVIEEIDTYESNVTILDEPSLVLSTIGGTK